MPGTRFRLALIVPAGFETEVANALRAWILFGGYGGRTRRGLGSLTVLGDVAAWLPQDASRDAFTHLFGFDLFCFDRSAAPIETPGDVPWLRGAALHVGQAQRSAMQAWTTALDWLKEFRQGTSGPQGNRARESGTGKPQPNRPSISNWPEADKIRHLERKTSAHPPRHNAAAAWPRAGFGLPIIGRFQTKGRDGSYLDEPGKFEIAWRSPKEGGQSGFDEHDRLASPLIVKALPFADGTFVPCALWLNRAYPVGEVILRGVAHSQAPFDRLVAPKDKPQFSALAKKQSLRQAFLDWLHAKYRTTVVAS
jgi:CRISPR-associated protein Cmr1